MYGAAHCRQITMESYMELLHVYSLHRLFEKITLSKMALFTPFSSLKRLFLYTILPDNTLH